MSVYHRSNVIMIKIVALLPRMQNVGKMDRWFFFKEIIIISLRASKLSVHFPVLPHPGQGIMLSASIRSQLDRVSVVFTICSILFLSVFEVVVFVFFFGMHLTLFWMHFCRLLADLCCLKLISVLLLCVPIRQFSVFSFVTFFIQRHSLFAVCLSFGFPYPHTLTHFYLQLMLSCSLLFCYMRLFWEICVLPNNNHHERTDRSLHSLASRLARL